MPKRFTVQILLLLSAIVFILIPSPLNGFVLYIRPPRSFVHFLNTRMAWSEKSYFKVLQRFRADYSTGLITKYESSRTGMQVLVVDAKGPKVHGFFTLATEIHDNSGARKWSILVQP